MLVQSRLVQPFPGKFFRKPKDKEEAKTGPEPVRI